MTFDVVEMKPAISIFADTLREPRHVGLHSPVNLER